MLFASHKHSFALSCISVKHFMSNATPQNMFYVFQTFESVKESFGGNVDQLTNSSLAGISENNLNKNLSSLLDLSVHGRRMYFPGGTSNLLVFAL